MLISKCIFYNFNIPNGVRSLFWDEENRLTSVVDKGKTISYYTYDAAGERTLKLTGNFEQMNINGQYSIDLYNINRFSLHTSPYIVFNNHGYTKHYYVEADRIASKIGGGMGHSGNNFDEHIYEFDISTQNDYGRKSEENAKNMYNHLDSAQSSVGSQFEVLVDIDYRIIRKFTETDEEERHIFFFHKDHLGSSTQISDMSRRVIHHIEYMPSGELFAEQRDYWHTPYRFNGKELDEETGYYYYGARYYTPEVGIWLSVDPLADKYPSISSFAYCLNNPVKLIDPNGMEVEYSSIEDRIKVAYLRLTSSDFRHSFKTLKKSEETYVFNGSRSKYRQQELTTDGDKLFINYSHNYSESQGTTWANNMKHESEHAMQFEHGEVGFELFDTGGPLGGDGTYYPNNEWKAVNFDLSDELKARDKGYDGPVLNSDKDKNIKNEWRFGDFSIEAKKQSLRNAGYKGEVPVNNSNHEKVKTPTQYLLPHRERTRPNKIN